jgi:hypothetical protein
MWRLRLGKPPNRSSGAPNVLTVSPPTHARKKKQNSCQSEKKHGCSKQHCERGYTKIFLSR